jgi:hypothetical protein
VQARPPMSPGATLLGRWEPATSADLTAHRLQLAAALHGKSRPAVAEEGAVERLLLAFEELVSNALRHGRQPVRVEVTAADGFWLLDVSDAAVDQPPTQPSAATPPPEAWGCTSSPASAPPTGGWSTAAVSTCGGASTTPASRHATPGCGRGPVRDRTGNGLLISRASTPVNGIEITPGGGRAIAALLRADSSRTHNLTAWMSVPPTLSGCVGPHGRWPGGLHRSLRRPRCCHLRTRCREPQLTSGCPTFGTHHAMSV